MFYLGYFCCLCLKTTINNSDDRNVDEKLEYLIPIYHTLQLSKIPKHFCDSCLKNLDDFYEFKQKCLRSIVISNHYVQKLCQENSIHTYLSVELTDVSYNIESNRSNSIENNVENINQELKQEIYEVKNYEKHQTEEIQEKNKSREPEQIKIENMIDNFEMKREITEEVILKFENSDPNNYIFECEACDFASSTEIQLIDHIFWCRKRIRSVEVDIQIQSPCDAEDSCDLKPTINRNTKEDDNFSKKQANMDDDGRIKYTKKKMDTNNDIKKSVLCDICQKQFKNLCNLRTHKRIHCVKKTINCEENFISETALNQHKFNHTNEKSYECDVCKAKFINRGNLHMHERVHTSIKPYKCDVCKKTYVHSSSLNVHKRIHTGARPYKCNICDKTFSQNSHLNLHKRIHTGSRPYKCNVCNKTFSQNANLIMHNRIHTGARPYQCDVCEKAFTLNCNLLAHKRIHTGERPYECDVCKKTFSRSSVFVDHKRIHTGARPYNCDVCKKTFGYKSCLNVHKRLHTGVKPYECDVCKKTFIVKNELNKHKQIHACENLSTP